MPKKALFTSVLSLYLLSYSTISLGQTSSQELLNTYPRIHKALAEDRFSEVAKIANNLKLNNKTEALSKTSDKNQLRTAFAALSEATVELVRSDKNLQASWQLFYCPMVPKGTFGYWIQKKGESLLNPYFGSEMLTCGVKRSW